MSVAYGEQEVICPYFVGENKQNILCEGICEGTRMMSSFGRPSEKETYKMNFCNRYAYMDCPYAKILDELRYVEENMDYEKKLKEANEQIKKLQEEKAEIERDNNALRHQVDWREREMNKSKASVDSTEMLTKYLVYQLAGKKELRVSVEELKEFLKKYDLIAVQDKVTGELVFNLVDKENNKILDDNYNDYEKHCEQMLKEYSGRKVYAGYVRVKQPGPTEDRLAIIKKAKKIVKKQGKETFPKEKLSKLEFQDEVFDNHEGSIIVAWFAIEKK
ncbi:MAG: hypothetical protein K6G85_00125 [Eubacterium sp.]|nr:hypothetical protein [Eubacterium sp.]